MAWKSDMVVKIHHGSLLSKRSIGRVQREDDGCDVPEERFIWTGVKEDSVDVVEVGKVGVYLEDPIWLDEDHGSNVDQGNSAAEEGFILHPGHHIM